MLDIPANAISTTTMMAVATTTAPVGYTLASAAYQFGPSGTTFAQPVAVTIPLTLVTTGVHLFWSNASGGFDGVGGTINGSSLTANVSHFSIGFYAVPTSGSVAGSSGGGGTSGVAGSSGGGGTSGVAGSSGGGGTSGTAGIPGTGGIPGNTDAGLSGDAAASSCKSFGLNLPFASITYPDASTPPFPATYAGGPIVSGRYYLNSAAQYAGGTYTRG